MNICVFGAASPTIDSRYKKATEDLCETLAHRGHNLVFGAGGKGLMGAAAQGFRKGGGRIIGVIPRFFDNENVESTCEFCDELVLTDTMRQRKQIMEDRADVFIVAPGGIGTFEEFFEVLTLKQLCRHEKPIVLFNVMGYYDDLQRFLSSAMDQGFIRQNCSNLYRVTEDPQALIAYIEAPEALDYSLKDYKNG